MRWKVTTLAIFFATLGLSVYLFVVIPKGFFPQQDNGLITATAEASQDISFAAMQQRMETLNKIVMEDPDVASVAMAIGGSGRAGNNGNMFITLKPRDERKANAQQIIARLRPKLEKVPDSRLYMQAAQDVRLGGRPTRTQFEFTLQDANLGELNEWAPKILTKMQTLPELRDVATDQQTEGTTVELKINRDTASRYGIQPQLIDDTLYDAFGQRQVTQYFTQLNSYHVILEILPDLQGALGTLDKIYIKSPATGDEVPLSTFASWTSVPVRPLSISHQGQFPAITISFNLAQGVALGQATDSVQKAMVDLGAPATLNSSFQGTAQAFQQSLSTVPLLILAALVVVYLILGILYESYIHPITILSTLPSAGVGALAILMAFGYDFSLIALIGIILLIGIVKKNGIMMVDFAIAAERDEHLSSEQSIRKAALLRFRPIMMTTMAAMLGGVPLMLGTGTGSEIRQPLGYAMVGGLIVSQALTLFTTPVIYLYLDKLSNAFSNWGRRSGKVDPHAAEEHGSVKEAAE
jgi:hydrophobic/amphiphilic exporter-1 (mainly G- bacteria), HAE1 family